MPKKILVSLLGRPQENKEDGIRHYNRAEYLINADGKSYSRSTEFSFDALNQVFKPDQVVIIGTQESIWERATEQTGINYQKVMISAGEQEADQWHIFETVKEIFNQDAEFILDITHGYRHLPVLTFLSAQFVRALNEKCQIKYVYYGLHNSNKTFMVDLSQFMRIMDWMYATRLFTSHGKGYDLADLLQETGDRDLSKVSTALSTLTDSLELLEVPGVPVVAQEIMTAVGKAVPRKNAEIYELLSDEMTRLPKALSTPEADWKKYLRLADWYEKHSQWAKAVFTLRENLVTFVGEVCQFEYDDYEEREKITKRILNQKKHPVPVPYQSFIKLWKETRDFRNSLGHTVRQRNPKYTIAKVKDLIHRSSSLLPQLLKQDPELEFLRTLGKNADLKQVSQASEEDLVRKINTGKF